MVQQLCYTNNIKVILVKNTKNTSIDVNPVQVKLGIDDVNQTIEQLADENRYKPPSPAVPSDLSEHSEVNNKPTVIDSSASALKGNSTPSSPAKNSPPTSPTKGTLEV